MTASKEKVVVTGGAGFIGSHIAEQLVADGYEVVIIDDLSTGRKENIEPFLDSLTFIEGSITDRALLDTAFSDTKYVIHQAAIPAVPRSIDDPAGTNDVNITGTLNVFMAARDAGVKRVVYASSSSVYGDKNPIPQKEDMPTGPLSPYAAQKMMGEQYGRLFHELFGLETVGLRYFNVFGPRQDPQSDYAAVIPIFIETIKAGETPTIFGDGETSRDFTHVDNVVQANIAALTAEGASGEVFNIALGESISLNDLVREINMAVGAEIKPAYEDFRVGDIKHSLADVHKAKDVLGYAPKVSFAEGIRRMLL